MGFSPVRRTAAFGSVLARRFRLRVIDFDFLVGAALVPAIIFKCEELLQNGAHCVFLVSRPGSHQALNVGQINRQRPLVLVVTAQAAVVGGVLKKG